MFVEVICKIIVSYINNDKDFMSFKITCKHFYNIDYTIEYVCGELRPNITTSVFKPNGYISCSDRNINYHGIKRLISTKYLSERILPKLENLISLDYSHIKNQNNLLYFKNLLHLENFNANHIKILKYTPFLKNLLTLSINVTGYHSECTLSRESESIGLLKSLKCLIIKKINYKGKYSTKIISADTINKIKNLEHLEVYKKIEDELTLPNLKYVKFS
jgi:hypothetical protein